ncbi:MAG TPA: iron uptake transporter permease EfeU [Anaerolineales bacterium]
MIASLLLSLREGLEAALIIGIVLGVLRKSERTDLNRPLWAGVICAFILSIISALLLHAVDKELEGTTEQIFEGVTLILATGVLTWMIFWMRSQSKSMKSQLETNVNKVTGLAGSGGLFFLSFIAVLREGIELALYLTAASLTSNGIQTLVGAVSGLIVAGLLGFLIYTSALRLNLQRFFQITGVLLILFAAGLIAHSVAEFNEAGIIPAIISPIWNLNPVLNDHSVLGTIFSTLFGYHASPSLTEALGYAGYILITLWLFVRANKLQTS